MKQIIITIGIPNSGKSTWAGEQWRANPYKVVVVNRDKIRELLFGYTEAQIHEYYTREDIQKLEKQVSKYEDTIIHEALAEGKTVIVDATHLRAEYIERFKFWNVPISFQWFDVDLDEAIRRNSNRNRQVPVEIMKKQFNQYMELRKKFVWDYAPTKIELNPDLPGVYLVDLDGTIALHTSNRSPFDWKRVGEDTPCPNLSPVIKQLDGKIIFVSGRDGVCQPETKEWLDTNNFKGNLLMRVEKDSRPDWKIKEEIWKELAKQYNILGLFDDRLQVVRRARALGLKVFNVEYNNF